MAAEPNFPFLFGTVDKTLATLVPLPIPQHDKLYKSIGVISNGTIECKSIQSCDLNASLSRLQLPIKTPIKPNLFEFHLMQMSAM